MKQKILIIINVLQPDAEFNCDIIVQYAINCGITIKVIEMILPWKQENVSLFSKIFEV